jgi:hypothetical protein
MAYWFAFGSEGSNGDWNGLAKIDYLASIFRNEWQAFDRLCAVGIYAILLLAVRKIGLSIEPRLGTAALLLFIAFVLMPGEVLGAHYADMRVVPYAVALALLATVPTGSAAAGRMIALAALIFFAARMGAQAWTYWQLDRSQQGQLAALDHVPAGAKIFAIVDTGCPIWRLRRSNHLGAMGIVRREAFVNGQWPMPGGRLLSVRYAPAEGFALEGTQYHEPEACRRFQSRSVDRLVRAFPRGAFDYLWLIDFDPAKAPRDGGLVPVWQGERGMLLRIAR